MTTSYTPEVAAVPASSRFELFMDELKQQSQKPPAGDPIIAAWAYAARDLLEQPGTEFHQDIAGMLKQRPDLSPSEAAGLANRALQFILVREQEQELATDRPPFRYPEEYDEASVWGAAVRRLLGNVAIRNEYNHIIHTRRLQTNVFQRYVSVIPIARAQERRLGRNGLSMLEIGCSRVHGLRGLSSYTDRDAAIHFDYVRADDEVVEKRFNQLLRPPFRMGPGLGVDRTNIHDPETRAWIRACSYPSELATEVLERYDLLDEMDGNNISFYQADFADPDFDKTAFLAHAPVPEFDLVLLFNTLYQMPPGDRDRVVALAKEFLKPDGAVIIQDFIKDWPEDAEPPAEPSQLDMPDNWFGLRYLYKTVLYDNATPKDGLQPVYAWETGRCRRVRVVLGRTAQNGFDSLGIPVPRLRTAS